MISINNLTSLYPNTSNGLKNFSCKLTSGVYALLGKNGSGKTTLFRNLIGAIFPQKGSCHLLGESIKKRNPEILKEIFLIPEEPYFPNVSSQTYTRSISPFYPCFNTDILHDLMKRWEVPKHYSLMKMSQGQKKKFLIAFALATQAKIMLFDEPTNGLDIESKVSFKNIDLDTFKKNQLFIFATHQIKDVENLIEHIILINEGAYQGSFPIETLKNKLITVETSKEEPQSLYSVKSQNHYVVLKERKREKKTSLDLEIFFTAFSQNPEKIKKVVER